MVLENVELLNFRNYSYLNLPVKDDLLLIGPNAQGKTNLLEAIYFASWDGSFRRIRPDDPINWQKNSAKIEISLKKQEGTREVLTVIFKRGAKQEYFFNKKSLSRKADLSKHLTAFYFSPLIDRYIHEEPAYRRKMFDLIISQKYRNYGGLILIYSKILKNRNFLLKKAKFSDLEVWNESLIKVGSEIILRRVLFYREINRLLKAIYSEISKGSDNDKVSLFYRSPVLMAGNLEMGSVGSVAEIAEVFQKDLKKTEGLERKLKLTLTGPQRDEVVFFKENRDLKFFSSRGEGFKVVMALKIAQGDYLGNNENRAVFLVDDLLQDLDEEKSRLFLKALRKRGQVIITVVQGKSLPEEIFSSFQKFLVKNGEVREWSRE